MNPADFYEAVGYSASVFVAISLMMRSVSKLRVINLIGAALFTTYGLMIGALPVAALNFFIVLVNLYYLQQLLRTTPEPLKASSQMLS